MRTRLLPFLLLSALATPISLGACGATPRPGGEFDPPDATAGDATVAPVDGQSFVDSSFPTPDGSVLPPGGETRDPVDCDEAKRTKSYVGCDYWPTINANNVWSIFDFAVVVSNTGANPATVTVTGPAAFSKQVTVPAGELKKIYLPWVPALKGPDTNEQGSATPMTASVMAAGSAYHLVSSVPVIVTQFNALEYKPAGGEAPGGGPKNWSSCPGKGNGTSPPCFSYSNDASLLLPSTAMTTNYRVASYLGWTIPETPSPIPFFPPTPREEIMGTQLTITATEDDTVATVRLAAKAKVLGGGGLPATNGGGTMTVTLAKAGDVAELVTDKGDRYDLSGSLITSTKPIQVIVGLPCVNVPATKSACDHVEESVLPAETLGKRYIVTMPSGPKGGAVKHWVRFVGNRDNTTLTYAPSRPAKCPATLQAGEVVDCELVTANFDVTGTEEFAVVTLQVGAEELGSATELNRGDPALSTFASVEQFRTKYLFLAPDDYDVAFVDIVGDAASDIKVDGATVPASSFTAIANGFGVFRVRLGAGKGGAHTLEAAKPVGIQVLGYGANTSYQYPGGLNLKLISIPPVPK